MKASTQPTPAPWSPRGSSLLNVETRWILAGILALGVLLRVFAYGSGRSLWWDEAALALNFFDASFAEVLRPLGNNQAAPAGFDLLTLAVLKIAGISEWSLRFLPFLCGLASLFVFYRLSRRWLRGAALLFTNYTFAIAPNLIYYSAEFKPYGMDVLVAMIMFLGVTAWWEDGGPRSYLPGLAVAGCLAVWLSFPVVLVMAGVGSVILAACCWEKKYSQLRDLAMVVAAWLVSFSFQYVLFSRPVRQANGAALVDFWRNKGAFMPFPPWTHPKWFLTTFLNYFHDVIGIYHSFKILHVLFIFGIIELVRRRAIVPLCALLCPFAIALFVSALTLYPFDSRLILFTVPFALLICGEGVAGLFLYIQQPWLRLAVIVIALFLPSLSTFSHLWKPLAKEEVRAIAEYLLQQGGSQDLVLVSEVNSENYDTTLAYYARILGLKQTVLPFPDQDYASMQLRIAQALQHGHRCYLLVTTASGSVQVAVVPHLQSQYRMRSVDQQVGAQLFAIEPL